MTSEHDSMLTSGHREELDIRRALLRVTTELYVTKPHHTAIEQEQFTELALRLIDLVDPPTCLAVLGLLKDHPDAPAAVLEALGHRPEAAAVGDPIELAPAAPQPSEPADEIQPAVPTTVEIPEQHDIAATPPSAPAMLFLRPTARELSDTFFAADAEERRLILFALDYSAIEPATALSAAATDSAVAALERAALMHNTEMFTREMERLLEIDRDIAARIIEDTSGEPLVVAALAIGLPEAVTQRILLCLNPAIAQSVQRVYDLAALHQEIDPHSARRLVAIWQATRRAARPATRPEATSVAKADPRDVGRHAVDLAPRPRIAWDEHASRFADHG